MPGVWPWVRAVCRRAPARGEARPAATSALTATARGWKSRGSASNVETTLSGPRKEIPGGPGMSGHTGGQGSDPDAVHRKHGRFAGPVPEQTAGSGQVPPRDAHGADAFLRVACGLPLQVET